jgi:hypothetical protein
MEIHIPSNAECQEIKLQNLKKDWHHDFDYTQWMGKEILTNTKNTAVSMPFCIVHKEHNYMINPLHADFKKDKAADAADFYFDERLFKKQPLVDIHTKWQTRLRCADHLFYFFQFLEFSELLLSYFFFDHIFFTDFYNCS